MEITCIDCSPGVGRDSLDIFILIHCILMNDREK